MLPRIHRTLVAVAVAITATGHGVVRGEEAYSQEVYYDYVNEAGQLAGGRVTMPATVLPLRLTAGASDNRIHLVLVGDGYTSTQLDTYATQADNVTSTLFATNSWAAITGRRRARARGKTKK